MSIGSFGKKEDNGQNVATCDRFANCFKEDETKWEIDILKLDGLEEKGRMCEGGVRQSF